ncbi:hypothetical protein RIR_jg3642.t2 [Rhizophagus irregularis DAOM 181602=DAOM 197198]|nr:hypothetical protein RIR_jg3642.t2 [Rhizophagus irregularis DAOM 181602=DAOM 197198]
MFFSFFIDELDFIDRSDIVGSAVDLRSDIGSCSKIWTFFFRMSALGIDWNRLLGIWQFCFCFQLSEFFSCLDLLVSMVQKIIKILFLALLRIRSITQFCVQYFDLI